MSGASRTMVIGLLCLAMAACSAPADPEPTPAPLVTHASPFGMDALFSGEVLSLDAETGCSWFGEGPERVALVWPRRHRLGETDDGRPAVLDGDGVVRAIAGEPVRIGGGRVDLSRDRDGFELDDVPEPCRTGSRVILISDAHPGTVD